MIKPVKKFILYSTAVTLIGTSTSMKLNCDQSLKFSKQVTKYTKSFEDDDFLICAHRGYSSKNVENTTKAIKTASKAKYVDYIEIDCRLSNDSKLILSHNEETKDNVFSSLKVSENDSKMLLNNIFTYNCNLANYAKSLFSNTEGYLVRKSITKLNNKKYKLSTLEDGLRASSKPIFLDIKFQDNTIEMEHELVRFFDGKDTSNIVFQSSDLVSLLHLKETHPEYNCLAIINKESELSYIDLFDNIGVRKNLIDETIVKDAVSKDKTISVWTLNKTDDIDYVIANVGESYKDIIYISDYPDMVSTYLNKVKIKEKKD